MDCLEYQFILERIEIVKDQPPCMEEAGGLINIITKNPKMQLAFQLMHLPPIGELNVDLGFKGNVGKSISTNRCELFNYSNPIDNNNDNFTDVTYKNAFCFSKMEFQSKA
jgi:outer membrane receptor for ferrienterochelin and colicins